MKRMSLYYYTLLMVKKFEIKMIKDSLRSKSTKFLLPHLNIEILNNKTICSKIKLEIKMSYPRITIIQPLKTIKLIFWRQGQALLYYSKYYKLKFKILQ